jgi:hypothetical protein
MLHGGVDRKCSPERVCEHHGASEGHRLQICVRLPRAAFDVASWLARAACWLVRCPDEPPEWEGHTLHYPWRNEDAFSLALIVEQRTARVSVV